MPEPFGPTIPSISRSERESIPETSRRPSRSSATRRGRGSSCPVAPTASGGRPVARPAVLSRRGPPRRGRRGPSASSRAPSACVAATRPRAGGSSACCARCARRGPLARPSRPDSGHSPAVALDPTSWISRVRTDGVENVTIVADQQDAPSKRSRRYSSSHSIVPRSRFVGSSRIARSGPRRAAARGRPGALRRRTGFRRRGPDRRCPGGARLRFVLPLPAPSRSIASPTSACSAASASPRRCRRSRRAPPSENRTVFEAPTTRPGSRAPRSARARRPGRSAPGLDSRRSSRAGGRSARRRRRRSPRAHAQDCSCPTHSARRDRPSRRDES